jgi:hypothetical protein
LLIPARIPPILTEVAHITAPIPDVRAKIVAVTSNFASVPVDLAAVGA